MGKTYPTSFLLPYFFNGFELRIKISIFIHLRRLFEKNIFWVILVPTFCKLLSQTRAKRLKKSKNVFYKFVLEFNFASLSELLIFSKKVNIFVAGCTVGRKRQVFQNRIMIHLFTCTIRIRNPHRIISIKFTNLICLEVRYW
jgi:hypothetical protein